MKPFSLEEYLKNPDRKIVDDFDRSVRIIATDRNNKDGKPIVALVTSDGNEITTLYTKNGKSSNSDQQRLFFAPEKHGVWIVIYKYSCGTIGTATFKTYPEAEQFKNAQLNVKIVKEEYLEWEE